jgi:restriction endonuclease S subunit
MQVAAGLRDQSELISPSPADWTEVRLAELCDLVPGTPTHDALHGAVPVLKPRNLVLGELAGPTDTLSADEAKRLARYQVSSGDLLCVRTGTVGRTGLVNQEQEGWIFGSGLIRIRVKPDIQVDPQFLSFYFNYPAATEWIQRYAQGTSIPNISSQVLGTMPVRLPPLPVQHAIAAALGRLNASIKAHQRVAETTTELRDTLLPLLMSGELPAPE